jgi:hypothetical protein
MIEELPGRHTATVDVLEERLCEVKFTLLIAQGTDHGISERTPVRELRLRQ